MADKPQRSWQARPEFNERRYRRVDTRVWNDARVRGFSPNGRLVWVFMLTAPSTTAIPGLFRLREEEGAALCGLSLEGFREGFAEGFRLGLIEADWVAGVVWVRKASRYEWPTAPNVVKNWRKVLRSEIPESPLVVRAMSQILKELQGVYEDPEPFTKAFEEAFHEGFAEGLPEPFGKGSPAQDAGCRMQDAGVTSSPPAIAEAAHQTAIPGTEQPPVRVPSKPTTAAAEFAEWAREAAKPLLAPDAPDNSALKRHQWAKLGEALKAHGALKMQAAFRLYTGDPYWLGKGLPLGAFVADWEKWVAQVAAPKPPATSQRQPPKTNGMDFAEMKRRAAEVAAHEAREAAQVQEAHNGTPAGS